MGEAKKRLSYLTSAPFNPLECEDQDGDEEGQEALRKGNRSRELVRSFDVYCLFNFRFDFIFKIVLIGDAVSEFI